MNDYIQFPGEQTLVPPGTFKDSRYFCFVLKADHDRLNAICNRYLNMPGPEGLAYSPVGVVILVFSHLGELTSADPSRGSFTYKDIAFWIPVTGGKTHSVCVFPPLIFVDDSATMASGREIFGLPKQLGKFEMPLNVKELDGAPAPQFQAQVVGTLHDGGRNDWRTLATINYVGKRSHADEPRLLDTLESLLLPSLSRGWNLPRWLSEKASVAAVGLKQFRATEEPRAACYQEIVETPLRLEKWTEGPHFFFDSFDLTLMDVPSHPVAQFLGLRERMRVPLAVYFEATMHMDAGRVVWRAP